MSNLRIFGILIGIACLIVSFGMYRAGKWKRNNFLMLVVSAFGLAIVSVFPSMLDVVEEMMSLEKSPRGRVISLLIFSTIAMWFALVYLRGIVLRQHLQFDKVVREFAASRVTEDMKRRLSEFEVCLLIPAFNESENLKELLPTLPTEVCGQKVGVLVIDDGSSDETYATCLRAGALVARNPVNRGGGAALRLGYDLLQEAGLKICVTLDADGQHRPEDIRGLISPILEERCDIAVGSRILGAREKGSTTRILGIYVFSFIINRLLKIRITDPASGFRAFRLQILQSLDLYEDQYHTGELIVMAARKGLRICDVPITVYERKHGMSKKGSDWKYGFCFARTILKSWLR
jgi:hypothetical protein